jgi:hypothetical protein
MKKSGMTAGRHRAASKPMRVPITIAPGGRMEG